MSRSISKTIFVCLLVGAFFAASTQIAVGISKREGSLLEIVERASANQIKRDSDAFRVPTAGQLKAWRFIVESIYASRPADAEQMLKQLSFPYELSLFTDRSSGREFFLLEEKIPLQAGWGLFAFDPRSANPLAIEIPHPVFDSKTEFEGVDAFLQTKAGAYILAGAHRRANKQDTPCTQPRSSDPDVNYPVSDVAHAVATPFHVVHEALIKARPATVAVQLHGMTERETCPNAFMSTGSATVTTNSKRLLSCLTKSGVEAQIYDGTTSCPLNALSNVQGRFSNGETTDPCGTGVKSSPEPGSFIHIEQEPVIRKDQRSWQPVVDGLKCAFPANAAVKAPERLSFMFKSPDNPEIKVFYSVPPKISDKTKILMVMAGRQRNADEYLDSWVDWAAKNDYLVLSPQFDEKNWPEPLGYNFGNIATGKEQDNKSNPKSKWAFTVIEQLFEMAKTKFGVKARQYDLFGHSAGGQFVHRFMLYLPDNHVRLAIAGNPGFYTLPDPSVKFPYGTKNSPVAITEKNILEWTNTDLVLMRGTADIERTESLRQTPEADAQGKNRFERAGFMFAKVKALNPKSKWQLFDVPGIAHDQLGMALAAQKVLEKRNQ